MSSTAAVTIRINGVEVKNSIRDISKEARNLRTRLSDMVVGTEEYNQAIAELGKANQIIRKHAKEANGLANIHKKNADAANGSIMSLDRLTTAAAAAFSVGQVIQFGRELFSLGNAMELQAVKARTVLGPALASIEAEARKNAAAMGMTSQEYVDNTAKLADLLVPMGFAREEAARLSNGVVKLGGAFSEWSNGQFSAAESAESVGKALLGSREELNRYGIDIKQSEVNARLAAKGMDQLTGFALKQAEALATLELVTEKSVDAQTAFAQGSDTNARRTAMLQARIKDLYETLATLMLPVFEKLIELGGGVTTAVQAIVDQVENLVDPIKAANKAFDDQKIRVENLESALPKLVGRYEELVEKSDKTNDEQAELFKVIADIAEIVPSAVTEFDQYGVALGINTEKTKEYVEAQKLLLQQRNQDQIDANQRELDQVNFQIKRIRALGDQTTVAINKDFGERVVKVSAETLLARNEELKALTAQAQNLQNAIKILKGEFDGNQATPPPTVVEGETDQERADRLEREAEARKKAAEEARKAREREAKDRAKALEDLEKQEADHRQRLADARMEEDELTLDRIERTYNEQIYKAIELESLGYAKAKDIRLKLEQLKYQELAMAQEGFAKRDAAEQAKRDEAALQKFSEYKEQELELLMKYEQQKADLATQLTQLRAEDTGFSVEETDPLAQLETRLDQQIQLTEMAYAEMLAAAEQHNRDVAFLDSSLTIDLESIEEQRQARLNAIREAYAKERISTEAEMQKEVLQANAQTFQALGNAFSSISQNIAGDTERSLIFKRAVTLAEIAFNTASAISQAVASSAGNPIAIIGSVAAVLAAIGQARAVFQSAEIPQYFEGGMTRVRGDRDGRTYNAKYLGRGNTGMLNKPVILAADHGPEYLVANHHLRNPKVLDHVLAIDALTGGGRNGRMRSVPQYNEGGITAQPQGSGNDNAALTSAILQNTAVLSALLSKLSEPSIAVLEDSTLVDINSRMNLLNRVAGGRIG